MTRGLSIARQRALNVSGRALARDVIPDSEVYLYDDWGDHKLTDRDDSGTTTYNGVEGVYRPEWAIDANSPTAENQKLQIDAGDRLYTDINLNHNETIRWKLNNVDVSNSGTGSLDYCQLFIVAGDVSSVNQERYREGYMVRITKDNGTFLYRVDGDDNRTELISGSSISTNANITVARDPNAIWELFINGSSQGQESDNAHTKDNYVGFTGRNDAEYSIDEIKAF